MEGLLQPDPKKRLGSHGLDEIKRHPFFEGVNWNNITQNEFFYIPEKTEEYQEETQLRKAI